MKEITTKFFLDNLSRMIAGERAARCGVTYWITAEDGRNGDIWFLSKERNAAGETEGAPYGKLVDGVPYKN